MLKVKKIKKYFGDEKILHNISFDLAREHKVALVGFNGTGKTTLLRILTGEESIDTGKVEYNKGITVGTLPQDPESFNDKNVLEFLKKYVGVVDESGALVFSEKDQEEFLRNVEIMFAGFNLDSSIKEKNIGDLSSGQKTKVFLSGILLKKVDLMLLDEPTNNLDLPALIWLENFLQNTDSAFIVVSHDKKFLDNVANKVYEIGWKDRTLEISNGKYSDYLERKFKEMRRQGWDRAAQQKDIRRLRALIRNRSQKYEDAQNKPTPDNDKAGSGWHKNRAGRALKKNTVTRNRINRMDIIDRPNTRKEFKIEIEPEIAGGSMDISMTNLVCGYSDNKGEFQIGPIDLDVRFGSKICILGLNGSGKTTLLKTITGQIAPISGDLNIGEGVKFGNLMQEHETLDKNKTVLKFLMSKVSDERNEIIDPLEKGLADHEEKGSVKAELQNQLKHFGFSDLQMNRKIKNISPGARARLLLAYFSATNVNVLILDEPTNHLDIEAQESLEKTLKKFEGTVLVVTHDRLFIEKNITESIYVLSEGILEKVRNFKDYLAQMQRKAKKLLHLLK
jgi:ATP-binding cassette subfamily F protein 3